jgi:hypothetical protein
MKRDITTQVWFGEYIKFNFGACEEEGLMDFSVCDESEPEDYEGRSWSTILSPDEMEYLAHRMLDAVAIYRKSNLCEPQETYPYGEPVPDYMLSPEENQRQAIISALSRNHGDRKKAAEYLKISTRTLYRMLKQYKIIE